MMPYTLNFKKIKNSRCVKINTKATCLRLLLIKWWSETVWMTVQVKKMLLAMKFLKWLHVFCLQRRYCDDKFVFIFIKNGLGEEMEKSIGFHFYLT